MPTDGTVLISYDGIIAIEMISTLQKLHLTRGGGLQALWRRWDEESTQQKGLFLPVVFSLMSIEIEGVNYNIVLKLNRINIDYPLIEEQWND